MLQKLKTAHVDDDPFCTAFHRNIPWCVLFIYKILELEGCAQVVVIRAAYFLPFFLFCSSTLLSLCY